MIASVTHYSPLINIRRERLLPVPGHLLVRATQKVTATDVIAEANLAPQHSLLNIAKGLGLPVRTANSLIQRKVGEKVSKGDLIAGPVGLLQRAVRAPDNGVLVAIGNGHVLMELESSAFELQAGMPGVVTQLIPERGVVIENTGALIQGVWGNGKIGSGLLNVIARSADDVITADQLDVSSRGAILLAGYCEDPDVLQLVADLPIRGLILASMASRLVPLALKMDFPILVVEGFGILPMNSAAFRLLSTNGNRDIAINAEPWDPQKGLRPEVIIPLPAVDKLPTPRETDVFAPGQQVYLHNLSSRTCAGTVVSLRTGLTRFPSGVRAPAAVVRLDNGEQIDVPLVNLDVIE